MDKKNIELAKTLEDNAREYYYNAVEAEKKKQFNSSVTLFFKALSSLADLYILKNKGFMPSNHTERFRILEEDYSDIYIILDDSFPLYQSSYRNKLKQETSEVLKRNVRRLFEILNISI
ncbi:hypothetical protein COU56_03505 [Candidatus Pacearchaeota archaeon CG10_big_fil_rev_8_21_14_0_10_31_9]|nr:MAG: hypothetical protein AUJ62_02185 [Candidatus Pacearchaeota archaeon CG1_02_32_21]PIN93599.1 MAG: hypothetical protein COU56_03505 [Candidatus Pacearchaeota archaeon CG10_big_fil_rev_8_21_14_0_10_31_9]PIZ82685.1 MAG: hypothetical protein COX97_03555 [Candidatus Pacearchaeota archaeon CG_4_10_14_0_2_um_filter_05_32_18]